MSMPYIRGGGGVAVDGRRLGRLVAGLCLAGLTALSVVLLLDALDQNSRTSRLRAHGSPVDVTVTGCVALASGTGITASGFTCRGTFTLGGQRHNEVIRGSTRLRQPGDTVAAVTLLGDPASLSTAASVRASSPWGSLLTPAILLLVVIVALGAGLRPSRVRRERARRRALRGGGHPTS
jgi:hypothetical protein